MNVFPGNTCAKFPNFYSLHVQLWEHAKASGQQIKSKKCDEKMKRTVSYKWNWNVLLLYILLVYIYRKRASEQIQRKFFCHVVFVFE